MVRTWGWVLAALGVGCAHDLGVTECPDGTVCPDFLECPAQPGDACVDPNATPQFCAGKPAGTLCVATIGSDGICNGVDDECVPTTCGDGIVQGREICDGGPGPATCLDRGYDYGRTTCSVDCSGTTEVTCGHIGWRDLELGLETRFVNDVAIVGSTSWAAGDGGVYRNDGSSWTRAYPPPGDPDQTHWLYVAAASPEDVWAFSVGFSVHWDGITWTRTNDISLPTFAEVSNGEVVVGVQTLAPDYDTVLLRCHPDGTKTQELVEQGGGWSSAFVNLGGEELIASSASAFDINIGFYNIPYLHHRPPGGSWSPLALNAVNGSAANVVPNVENVSSLGGTSLDDILYSGYLYVGNTQTFPSAMRLTSGATKYTVAPIVGKGWILPYRSKSLLLRSEGSGEATTYGGKAQQRLTVPGPVRLAAASTTRVIAAIDSSVYEMGGALWSKPIQMPTSANALTMIQARSMSASPSGKLSIIDKQFGLLWQVDGGYGPYPIASEWTRSIGNLIASWEGADGHPFAIDASAVYAQQATFARHEFLGGELRDIAGHSSSDVLIVGNHVAHHWDGSAWMSVPLAGLTLTSFRAVVAIGSGSYMAVGDDGLVAIYDGTQWQQRDAGTTASLRDVAAVDADTFAAISNATVVRCANGTCVERTLGFAVTGVALAGASDIFIVGSGHTEHFDGVDWSPVKMGGREPVFVAMLDDAIWFADAAGGLERLVRLTPWTLP